MHFGEMEKFYEIDDNYLGVRQDWKFKASLGNLASPYLAKKLKQDEDWGGSSVV
jgi:hypothetical protein